MYEYDYLVRIPELPGRLIRQKKGETTYISVEYERTVDPETHKVHRRQVTIGKLYSRNPELMWPTERYAEFFPDSEEEKHYVERSSSISVGPFLVLQKLMEDFELPKLLRRCFSAEEVEQFLDLAAYVTMRMAHRSWLYSDYIYSCPRFTQDQSPYLQADQDAADFLESITEEQRTIFLNAWREKQNAQDPAYLVCNCMVPEKLLAEPEWEQDPWPWEKGNRLINLYAVAYRASDQVPVYLWCYPEAKEDRALIRAVADMAEEDGVSRPGFILNTDTVGPDTVQDLDQRGSPFLLAVQGYAPFAEPVITAYLGTFENDPDCAMIYPGMSGMTVRAKLSEEDEKERWFHLYYEPWRERKDQERLDATVRVLKDQLEFFAGQEVDLSESAKRLFHIHLDPETNCLVSAEENTEEIRRLKSLAGYTCVITSEEMTAKQALDLSDIPTRLEHRPNKPNDSELEWRRELDAPPEEEAGKSLLWFVVQILARRLEFCGRQTGLMVDDRPPYANDVLCEVYGIQLIRRYGQKEYQLDRPIRERQWKVLQEFGLDSRTVTRRINQICKKMQESAC